MAEDVSELDETDEGSSDETLTALQVENAALKDQALRYAAEA